MSETLNENHREELIATLVLWTGGGREAFENMDDRQLLHEHDRRVGK